MRFIPDSYPELTSRTAIHAVDKVHNGTSDSSVLYIPVCPLTELNAKYLVKQRKAFLDGTPGPDFPGGMGESEHVGRTTAKDIKAQSGSVGLQAMGLEKLVADPGSKIGASNMAAKANEILGF